MRLEQWFYALPLRLRSLFRRDRVEQDLDEELEYHLERKIEEHVAQGMTPGQARHAALRAMDGLAQRKEECRDMRRVNAIEDFVQDSRYALRLLAKSPGFTVVAILTLALAIGANAVAFGILDGLVLRPLNVPRVESLWGTAYGDNSAWQSYPNYLDLRDRNRSFEALAAFNFVFAGLDTGNDAALSTGYAASGNYFDVLGIQPHLGRFFHASDEQGPNSAPYVVLSHSYWSNRFSGDRGVVGRTVRLNKRPFTIIGVAPPEFIGTLLFVWPDFFLPIVNQEQLSGETVLNARGNYRGVFMAIGHLKPGVTPAQAMADVKAVGSYLQKTYPNESGHQQSSLVSPSLTSFGRPVRAFVAGLMVLSGLILLAACANLGSLFSARAADRSREVALRLALGSSRNRILRQLLTEALLISLAGGVAGLMGSVVLLRRLSLWQPFPGAPIHVPLAPDTKLYAVALVLALVCAFLFGMVPVRQVLRANPYEIVKAGSTGTFGQRMRARDLLLAVQIALCALLVTSSLVAVRGLVRSLRSNFGFEPRNTMLVSANLAMGGYSAEQAPAMQKRMIDALRTIPGVERVGLISDYPPLVNAAGSRVSIFKEDAADLRPANAAVMPYSYEISPEYLEAAGTALLAGRSFSWHDDRNAPPVAVVNREFAVRMFGSVPGAVGRSCRTQDGTRIQVVGVVEDGKYLSLTEDQEPAMFTPSVRSASMAAYLLVRSARNQDQLAAAMRSKLRELDAGLPVDIQTWDNLLQLVLFPARVATMALGVLGVMGAMLSITGIFGMAAHSVGRRLKELGIRMALGAQRREVLRAALGRSVKLLAFGSAAGLLLGILASRVLAFVVYQATPRDPLVLAGVVLAMALLGLLATWIPAQRALTFDPVALLREE